MFDPKPDGSLNQGGSPAFTLVEVLMVMLILGIMAAFAYPAYSTWIPSYSLKSAAKDLYSNLHLAKGGAIKTNRPWAIFFDSNDKPGRYFICSNDGGDGWDAPVELGGNDVVETTVRLADYKGDVDFGHGVATKKATTAGGTIDKDISYTGNAVKFNSDGTLDGLNGYVYLSNRKGEAFAVGTPVTAGVVVIKRWSHGEWKE